MNHFGTDGIRGRANIFDQEYITKIIKAVLMVEPEAKFIIGRDTRQSGAEIEDSLCKAILTYGGSVIHLGMTATPALAFFTEKLNCDFGIMISASHNPPEYNGIKFFGRTGEKISDEIERQIDYNIDNLEITATNSPIEQQQERYVDDEEYIDYLISELQPSIKGMKICLDCANGSASKIASSLFERVNAQVDVYNNDTSGIDINNGCGATRPEHLLKIMQNSNYDIGFAYDGDGDRLIACVGNKIFNGDHLLYVHGVIMKQKGKLNNNVITGTIMANMGMERACQRQGIKLVRTNVGDKFVYREMVKGGYNIGGEESGHIIFSDYMKTSDGILTSLLTAMLAREYSLLELDDIEEYPKAVDFCPCSLKGAIKFYKDKEIKDYLNTINFEGRIVVRPSGTEPIIRILVEAEDEMFAKNKAREIKEFITRRQL